MLRAANYEKSKLAQASVWHRRSRDAREWTVQKSRAKSSWWWLFVAMFGLVWLPVPWGFRLFATHARAESFLQALWQVEGATLAISLAVVIFVFQAVYASRLGGSLRQFAEDTALFPIFFVGVYAIGLVGFVLLGGGYGAPGGWAGTWATTMAALVGLLLIYLFISTISAIEPSALHKRLLGRARREIERETERVILQRIATNMLGPFCEQHDIEFQPILGTAPSQTAVGVTATRAGEVRDVKLGVLRQLAEKSVELGLCKPRLRVYPDVRVSETLELFWAEPQALAAVWRPGRIVRVRDKTSERAFRETIEQLHDEATRLLANPVPGAYGDILAVYKDMILTLPRTWAEYGQLYGPGVAGGASLIERDFLSELESDLYDEMRSAVLGANREVARQALHFPLGIVYGAVELRASALSAEMFRLLAVVLQVLFRAPSSDTKDELLDSIALSLDNYGNFKIEPMITEGDSDAREFGRVAMLQLYDCLAEICKRALDADPTQLATIGKFNGIYEKFFQHWQPEYDRPYRFELEHAQERGEDELAITTLRAAVEAREAQVTLREELDDACLLPRLGLMFWILRRVRDTGSPDWAAAWPSFANYFGEVPQLARVTDKAIEAEFNRDVRWSDWILETLPSGQAYSIGVDGELLDAFIVRALDLVSPDGPVPVLEPMEWTRGRLDDPAARIQALRDQPNLASLLPNDRIDDRAAVLVEALEASNRLRKDRDDQKTIDAPLSAVKEEKFRTDLRRSFENARSLHAALVAAGKVLSLRQEAPDTVRGSAMNTWLPKDLFVEDPRVVGGDMIASQYGFRLAAHERDAFVVELRRAALTPTNAEKSLADQLRMLVADLRDEGYVPTVILCSSNWTTLQSLQVERYAGDGGDAERPAWAVGEETRASLAGSFDGIPTLQISHDLDDRIVVVDLSRFATWREWNAEGQPTSFNFKYYNDVEAEQLARDNPELFRDEGDLAARTKTIRMSVWVKAESRDEIEVEDIHAARALAVPEGLRR